MHTTFRVRHLLPFLLTCLFLAMPQSVRADVPDGWTGSDWEARLGPRGTVPNPGTQEQELANITLPAPYNVFEFVVTCAACHGGTVDQNAAHFGNWAGTSMASATRDPVFRAVQIALNAEVAASAGDGAGNLCFRCHSPNAWLSGRTDPQLAGHADGTSLMHSILLSTDDEGIMCETCHRAIGSTRMQRDDLDQNDPAWNMLAGVDDWPHAGDPYPYGPLKDLPYGDATLQYNDGMTYGGKYAGSVDIYFSDIPLLGTYYTGQTYAVNPPLMPNPGEPYVAPDGSVPLHYEMPIGPPTEGLQHQAISLEHPTFRSTDDFVLTPEFCGSCHDLTVPILNSGMPEQRTYTEWRYSAYGDDQSASYLRCQDCHMPTMKHEYADNAPVSVNPDPVVSGWFPYAKDRNPNGGTAFHKLAGANRDLPQMMQLLYPEPDLEVLGAQTGVDTRVFPGMLSTRDPMFERNQRNSELMLHKGVDVAVTRGPVEVDANNHVWEVDVRVTNLSGHRIPSGYPDGRRIWLALEVDDSDAPGTPVYQSGVYDEAEATLYTDAAGQTASEPFNRALSSTIDAVAGDNAVMVYEKLTGSEDTGNPGNYIQSPDLLNSTIVFDNRIPPLGFDAVAYSAAGTAFVTYNPATWAPQPDPTRYPDGVNYDVVTYRFTAPETAVNLTARASVQWQTHSREFMDYIKNHDTSTYQPEGPINAFMAGYPLSSNYLWDGIDAVYKFDLDGAALSNNWGGVAYAAWLATGKGTPYLCAVADTTTQEAPLTAPVVTGYVVDPFTIMVDWTAVDGAEGYLVEVRLGLSDATASWDQLAVVKASQPRSLVHTALNVAKTYGYRIRAFNTQGEGPVSQVTTVQTPTDLPLPPENLQVSSSTDTSITLTWQDASDNEDGFVIQRQDVPVTMDFQEIARVATRDVGGFVAMQWTDNGVVPGMTYNYRVAAYNASGLSTWTVAVQGSTTGTPSGAIQLSAGNTATGVSLSWDGLTGVVTGYKVYRSTTGPGDAEFSLLTTIQGDVRSYLDTSALPDTQYWYKVALDDDSLTSNVATLTTWPELPAAPTNLNALAYGATEVRLSWIDNATSETGYQILRSVVGSPDPAILLSAPADATAYIDNAVTADETYSYVVYATNQRGDSALSNPATVITPAGGLLVAPPLPAFLPDVAVIENAPVQVSFTNQTDTQGYPAGTTYLWDFGDTATSTETSPTHVYTTPGTYTVTLTATGPGGSNTLIKTALVFALPGASLTGIASPQAVALAGAMWRMDSGTWLPSGTPVSSVSIGDHLVEFLPMQGYQTPASRTVTVGAGQAVTTTGVYTLVPAQIVDVGYLKLLLLQ